MKLMLLISFLLVHAFAWSGNLVDPTKPNGLLLSESSLKKKQGELEFVLEAIIIRENNKQAVINGIAYQEGQMVNKSELILVNVDSVVLKSIRGNTTLKMNPQSIKKDINNEF